MPLQQTTGNVTTDAYGGGVAAVPNYIEDVFSTYLYTGNGGTQSINNGIDLAGKGGLVWTKQRTTVQRHYLFDTSRGAGNFLSSNATAANIYYAPALTSFNSDGFTLGNYDPNESGFSEVSWTFRKQPKFFDVVTFTEGSASTQTISHSLGSVPAFIILKPVSTTGNWNCYHQSLGYTKGIDLNLTAAAYTQTVVSATSSTTFDWNRGTFGQGVGTTWVAYIYASNAGGFGLTGTDNVITCGSFTSDSSGNATVNLGYEPQWYIKKNIGGASNWIVSDVMRGWSQSTWNTLTANTTGAEAAIGSPSYPNSPTATGFIESGGAANATYIYIAIRRGPMKVPTDATKVFKPTTMTGNTTVTTNFPVDLIIDGIRNTAGVGGAFYDRLRGSSQTSMQVLFPYSTAAETNYVNGFGLDNNTGYIDNGVYGSTTQSVQWNMRRAPSFFDEVCYTGTGSTTTQTHNLGVAPELMIVKCRSTGGYGWYIYSATFGINQLTDFSTSAFVTSANFWGASAPTSSVFGLGTSAAINGSGISYVAYLFATCASVSKVGTYTGNGSTQTINCGFTGGARFVLIKRTDSTGNWYVYDTARGMTTLTDPYLLMNSTAAETATLGSVTSVSTGFAVNASILAAINTNAASYIFLAIA